MNAHHTNRSQESIGTTPEAVRALLDAAGHGAAAEATRVQIGADAWRCGDVVLHRFDSQERRSMVTMLIERLAAASFPVAEVIGGAQTWLATAHPIGQSADRPDLHADPDDLVVAVGGALRRLHELPAATIADVPGIADGWDAIVDRCRSAVEADLIDSQELPYPYDQYQPGDLLSMLIDGRPARDEPVCCHGAPTIDRFIVEGGTFTGFDRLDTMMVADRHLDLAVIHRSVQDLLGPEAVFRFYDAYGSEPDLVRLDHYILASHLSVAYESEPLGDGRATA